MSAPAALDVAARCIDCHRSIEDGPDEDGMVDCTHCGAACNPTHPDLVPEPSMANIRAAKDRESAIRATA